MGGFMSSSFIFQYTGVCSTAAAVEVFAWSERNAESPVSKALKRPGYELQRAFGTREPDDICFYPRSGNVFFRGIGLVTRLAGPLDYWDGED